MASTPEQYRALFERLLASKLTPEDSDKIIDWLSSEEADPAAAALILEQLQSGETVADESTLQALEYRLQLILNDEDTTIVRRIPFYQKTITKVAAAVVLLFGLGIGYYLLNKPAASTGTDPLVQLTPANEINPGKDGAVLTLVDGSTVVLDSMGNGLVTTQNGTKVMLRNGQLVYDAGQTAIAAGYNTMTTPKGRQFQLVLPDGSKVWLNAASSIRYPTVFAAEERLVEISGEAYFEVAHNAAKPFRVKVNEATTVEVLGTHFNINSYSNEESINTSLLQGAVRVLGAGSKVVLKPGQQARYAGTGDIKVLSNVNMEKVVAWKNGVFDFEDATLEEVMRQLERWYDIEVAYEKNIPRLEFYGKMGKDLSLETVLNGLEKSNVHFRMEAGRKLIVLP